MRSASLRERWIRAGLLCRSFRERDYGWLHTRKRVLQTLYGASRLFLSYSYVLILGTVYTENRIFICPLFWDSHLASSLGQISTSNVSSFLGQNTPISAPVYLVSVHLSGRSLYRDYSQKLKLVRVGVNCVAVDMRLGGDPAHARVAFPSGVAVLQ